MNNDLNQDLLLTIKESYKKYLECGPRSNEKLVGLHGFIAKCLEKELGADKICSRYSIKSLGYNDGKEGIIRGVYYDKKVDITIYKDSNPIAGIAVKFVTSNYSQNSNNYFENMLGETANIRSNGIPYFQIFLIQECVPYFNENKEIEKYEKITENKLYKYIELSNDSSSKGFHIPNKTFIGIFTINNFLPPPKISRETYIKYFYNNNFSFSFLKDDLNFGPSVIYNDFTSFIEEVCNSIINEL